MAVIGTTPPGDEPAPEDADALWRFGEFRLDTASQRLLRGDSEISLSPKAFRVLALLASNSDEVITKDRLLDEVWADVHVLEGVVKVCVAEIRRALGESAAQPLHLHTVQRRGYRFAGPVAREARADRDHEQASITRSSASAATRTPLPRDARAETTRQTARRPEARRAATADVGPAPGPGQPERRQLTIISCDLAGRADLDEKLDVPSLREVLVAFQQTCAAIVRSLGGEIVQDLEQGLIIYFGYPRSHEDDAVRAVRVCLRILERLPALRIRLAASLSAQPLEARLAVHTGPVVVGGPDGHAEPPELGDTIAVATALQTLAEPGTVVLSDPTRRIVHGVFLLEDLGEQSIEGLPGPLPRFRAVQATGMQSRLDGTAATQLTPIVGREQEIAFLLNRWERARDGQGQGILLSGEAGMGKSRLIQILRQRIGDEPHSWLELRGSAFHRNSAFHPVVELLQRALLLAPDDSPEEQAARVEIGLEQAGLPVNEMLPLFADLLSLPLPTDCLPLDLSPETHRQHLLEAMCGWLLAFADQQPVILAAEDLHWTDPSTIEFLGMLTENAQMSPILIVITHRPEFAPPWQGGMNLAVLPLHGLQRKQVDAMVENVAGGKAVPRSVREHVFEKTDGVPLYVEEITKSLLESNLLEEGDRGYERTDPLPAMAVPSTLQDSLEARLDRLGEAKEVSQLAAVLGREFSHEVLETVSPFPPDPLSNLLAELVDSGLLYRRGMPPRTIYGFKHALIQETAYASLVPSVRREHHARIARALESSASELLESEPESVARHYAEAGLQAEAVAYYERAGARAASHSANEEAIAHLGRAIALVGELPESSDRNQKEIDLQIAIGAPLLAARGFGSPEVETAYARATTLARGLGDSIQLAVALEGLAMFFCSQSRLEEAAVLAEQQRAIAERLNDVERLLSAHQTLGMIDYFAGRLPSSIDHFERVTALYDPIAHRDVFLARGEHVGSLSRVWSSWVYWLRGYPERALEASRQAIEIAREAAQPFSLAYTLTWAAVLNWNMRRRDAVIELAEEAIAISEVRGFAISFGVSKLVWYRTLPKGLSSEETLAEAEPVLAALAATGNRAAVPQILCGFAEFCLECGSPERAEGYLQAALALSASSGQPHWDAEIHRVTGEMLLARRSEEDANGDARAEAEAALRLAIEVAVGQQARTAELRAATALARLLRDTDRTEEARAVLGPILEWFDEDLSLSDWTTAKDLLADLH